MTIHIQFVPFVCFKQIVAEDNKREMKKKRKKRNKISPSFFSRSNADLALKKPAVEIRTMCMCVCVCVCVGRLPRTRIDK